MGSRGSFVAPYFSDIMSDVVCGRNGRLVGRIARSTVKGRPKGHGMVLASGPAFLFE